MLDNVSAVILTKSFELEVCKELCSISKSALFGDFIVTKLSTKKRYPLCVGILPAEVCGLEMKPASSRSFIIFLIDAELRSRPEEAVKVFEPTGWPSAI